jgi:hypothetical protein
MFMSERSRWITWRYRTQCTLEVRVHEHLRSADLTPRCSCATGVTTAQQKPEGSPLGVLCSKRLPDSI